MKKKIFNIEDYENISATEEYIMNMINKNPELILEQSIDEFAKSIGASQSSISRFTRKLNFKNLSGLKVHVALEIGKMTNYIAETMHIHKEEVNDISTISMFSIKETLQDAKIILKLYEFIEKISLDTKVIIFGIESSFLAAQELSTNLSRLGINSVATSVLDTLFGMYVAFPNRKVIIFSDSMKNKSLGKFIKNNSDIIAITSNKMYSDVGVIYKTIKFEANKNEIASKYIQLAIADVIYLRLINKFKIHNDDMVNKIIKQIS